MDSGSFLTPTDLVARVRNVNRVRIETDLELLRLAVAWADMHPDPDERASRESVASGQVDPADVDGLGAEDREELDEWRGLPTVAWDAPAGLGTALGRSTGSAQRLIRDGLVLRHRLPLHWQLVEEGKVEAFRARRVADLVAGCPDDVCDYIDEHVAPIAATAGVVTLDRILEEAWLILHADQVELDRQEALAHRHVTVDQGWVDHKGLGDLSARADWPDLAAFDAAVAAVAAKLAEQDEAEGLPPDSLDVRRSRALGILADPARAQALLDGAPTGGPNRRTDLWLYLSSDALRNRSFVGRDGRLDTALVADAVRDWCGRSDSDLHVHPVVDLDGHERSDQYGVPSRTRVRVELNCPTCVFPWCTRPARRCDKDHRVPYDEGGATCDCNLAPLCRRHHRLKTHRGFSYTIIEPGTWLWRTPHGLQLIRDRDGTRDVTPEVTLERAPTASDPPWDGCLLSLAGG